MEGAQARLYFRCYKVMVGHAYAFIHPCARERSTTLLRAWSDFACPLLDTLWVEDANPVAVQTAHDLIGWLQWLQELTNPEAFFRDIHRNANGNKPSH